MVTMTNPMPVGEQKITEQLRDTRDSMQKLLERLRCLSDNVGLSADRPPPQIGQAVPVPKETTKRIVSEMASILSDLHCEMDRLDKIA